MVDGTWLLVVFLVLLGLSLVFLAVGLVLKSSAAARAAKGGKQQPGPAAGGAAAGDVTVKVDEQAAA
jgi:hypothetical protein